MRHTDTAVTSEVSVRVRACGGRRGVTLALMAVLPTAGVAQQPAQTTFASAEQASESLFAAVKSDNVAALLEFLGPGGQDVIASGDSGEDARERAQFVRKYEQMHRLAQDSSGKTVLYVGAENWPMPIPLVEVGGAWHFDTDAGKSEILFRRIGRNELAAIRVCHALVDAERDYFAAGHEGLAGKQYAARLVSDSGKEDGLYWKTTGDQPSSPIGPLLAAAARSTSEAPFHGYYYRILTRQGPSAPGGAKSYLIVGKLTGGFAFVAYPAVYQSSGVMTFIVNQADVVYQKDLGPDTASLATALAEFDPDSTWHAAEP
jgi:hypothetical protein